MSITIVVCHLVIELLLSKLVSKNTTENDFVIVSKLNIHKVKAHFFLLQIKHKHPDNTFSFL